MNASTPHEILRLPISLREHTHHGRERKGFHVYLSRFFLDFRGLSEEGQTGALLEIVNIRNHANISWTESDLDSVDSTDTPEIHSRHINVLRLACKRWNEMTFVSVESWKKRAALLNERPIPGRYDEIPGVFVHFERTVLDSMHQDWEKMFRIFKNAIVRPPKRHISNLQVSFGKERVSIHSQSYKAFYFNVLMQQVTIGDQCISLKECERVESSKKVWVIHIASAR